MDQKKANKKINIAELKSEINLKKSISLKRLEHDLKEIKNQIIPIPGVTAGPINNNIYEWHGNIKCLRDNDYKGAVLHLKFIFPKNYPLSPPDVFVLNRNIVHPNILSDGKICLDILEKKTDKKDNLVGWRSVYTVLSILSQLQNFFFDVNKTFLINDYEEKKELEIIDEKINELKKKDKKEKDTEKKEEISEKEKKEKELKEKEKYLKKIDYVPKSVKDQLESWSEYTCEICKSHGNSKPIPEFPEKEKLKTELTIRI